MRNADDPLRVLLSAEIGRGGGGRQVLAEAYGVTVDAGDLGGRPEPALFGVPGRSGRLHAAAGRLPGRGARRGGRPDRHDRGRRGVVVGGCVYGLLGTDAQGRDLAEGLLFGLPVALLIGLAAAVVSTAIGTGLGLLSGLQGRPRGPASSSAPRTSSTTSRCCRCSSSWSSSSGPSCG